MTDGENRYEGYVNKYLKTVLNWAYHYYRDREDAEDATAEAFLRLWNNSDNVINVQSWLISTVHNYFLNEQRARRRHPEVSLDAETAREDTLGESRADINPDSNPVMVLERNEEIKALEECIGSLGEGYREVVIRLLRDDSYEQIALDLHIPIGTVKSRFFAAKIRIARCLRNGGYLHDKA